MPPRLTPRRRLLAALSLVAVLAAAFTTTSRNDAGAALGDCTPEASWGTERADLAGQVVTLVNQHRAGLGLVSLQVSPSLTKVAVWKARHMAAYGYMAHNDPAPPIARTTAQRFFDCGYPSNAGWGENIAYGYPTASAVMNGWLGSSGHRANIERSTFRAIGVGAAATGGGTIYWAQAFGTSTFDVGGGGPTLPTVGLTSAPPSSTTSTSASFGWTTTGSPTSTTCSLDSGSAVACTSPRSYSGLAVGSHTFRVTVTNPAGSATAQHTWNVTSPGGGTTAPTVSITSAPAASTTATSATFGWSATGSPTSTTCSLDSGSAVACTSPRSYSGLSVGSHTFRVTVTNSAGSATALHSWTVTSSGGGGAPTISVTQGPMRVTSATTATFAWTTTGTVTATTCSLDNAPATPCSSPKTYSGLSRTSHTFRVNVTGPGGTRFTTVSWRIY
jgi:uncharacterized protein YkwD